MIPLVAVVGPTASGKTDLAIAIAIKYGGEIISADSMQIYKTMDIGTAKPTIDEMRNIPHHMLDIVEPSRRFSVADYVVMARDVIKDVDARGKLPVLAGGTGLYVSSLVDNIEFGETETDQKLRIELEAAAREQGGQALLDKLAEFDPETAGKLHPNNVGRIIRAIEVYKTTGVAMSEMQRRSRSRPSPYKLCMIGLTCSDRAVLYGRINRRVDKMIESGLKDEVERLIKNGADKDCTSMQAIGYKEMAEHLRGMISFDEAVETIKRETRRYAKRQLTWFRRDTRIQWIDIDTQDSYEKICKTAFNFIDKSNLL